MVLSDLSHPDRMILYPGMRFTCGDLLPIRYLNDYQCMCTHRGMYVSINTSIQIQIQYIDF